MPTIALLTLSHLSHRYSFPLDIISFYPSPTGKLIPKHTIHILKKKTLVISFIEFRLASVVCTFLLPQYL